MYKIIVRLDQEERELLAFSYEELRAVITLCPEAGYEILEVKKLDYDFASEFLEEIQDEIKPDDLVYGVKKGDGCEFLNEANADDCVNLDENYPHIDMY